MTNTIKLSRLFAVLFLGLLLAFPAVAREGAASGLLLWFNVVLPTLAPFLIGTQLIAALDGVSLLTAPVSPLFRRLFRLSPAGSYALLCGLLCGCPLGAKTCADLRRQGAISRQEAAYLLAIGNHPSPMFLLGYVRGQLPVPVSPLLLLLCLYLPILPLSLLARRVYGVGRRDIRSIRNMAISHHGIPAAGVFSAGPRENKAGVSPANVSSAGPRENKAELSSANISSAGPRENKAGLSPANISSASPHENKAELSMEDLITSACETLVIIGGYIMLFSILAAYIGQITILPREGKALLAGLAEMTTGIHQICLVFPREKALLPAVAVTAFGGLSGLFQTRSVIIKNAGLSVRHYAGWKLLHALLSCIILEALLRMSPLR